VKRLLLITVFSLIAAMISFPQETSGDASASSDYNEFSWFNNYLIAFSYNGRNNTFIGYETIFFPGNLTLPYPFSLFGAGANINVQFQFETQHFFIRNQHFIIFPYPLLLGVDFLYNINTGTSDFAPVLGLCLFYPGLKIMFRKNIFRENQNLEFIFAISPPFYVKEKQW
jgi:hypothetical protein